MRWWRRVSRLTTAAELRSLAMETGVLWNQRSSTAVHEEVCICSLEYLHCCRRG